MGLYHSQHGPIWAYGPSHGEKEEVIYVILYYIYMYFFHENEGSTFNILM